MVCEAFSCPPSVARQQDWGDVRAILDYRNAARAVELFNAHKISELGAEPGLLTLLLDMLRAQLGDPTLPVEAIWSQMREPDEEEGLINGS